MTCIECGEPCHGRRCRICRNDWFGRPVGDANRYGIKEDEEDDDE